MTSAINPQNIDGAYPVAGQDNDSQGFRDNFTNTKSNFQIAKNEISDLQSKVLLKAPLTGTTLDNDMGAQVLFNGQLRDMSETVVIVDPASAVIDYTFGPYQTLSMTGNVSISFLNFPAAGTLGRVRLRVTVDAAGRQLTLPPAVSIGTSNIQGLSGNIITFNQAGTFEFEFESSNGGAAIVIIDQNRNLDPMYLPSFETFAANGNISLSLTSTVITANTNITGNLLSSTAAAGQIKTLIYGNASTGNCLVNVVNAGWKASGNGTANLSAVGSAATFVYLNSKWYCIGNNGVVFT